MDSRFINKSPQRTSSLWKIVVCGLLIVLTILTFISIQVTNKQNRIAQEELLSANSSDVAISTSNESGQTAIAIDLSSYTSASAELLYSIEDIKAENGSAFFSGWLINTDDIDANGNIYICINGAYYPCQIISREDVAEHYVNEHYLNTGFSCMINIENWTAEEYPVTLCSVNNKTRTIYPVLIQEKLVFD